MNDRDRNGYLDPDGELVLEQYLHSADIESIKKKAEQMAPYGKCRIAKLVFVD